MFCQTDLKPFIENVITRILPPKSLKNCSITLGLSQLVSTIVPSRTANKKNKNKEEKYGEINVTQICNTQACHKTKVSTQENPTTPSQADTDQQLDML